MASPLDAIAAPLLDAPTLALLRSSLPRLHAPLASRGRLDVGLASAAVSSLRSVYTALWHAGRLTPPPGPAAARSGVKRRRAAEAAAASATGGDDAGAVADADAAWLRAQFDGFLAQLFTLLARRPASASASASVFASASAGDAFVDLQVLALSTAVHFTAHAASLQSQRQQGGPALCWDVVLLLLRHLLCAGGRAAEGLGDEAAGAEGAEVGAPRLQPYLTADLGAALLTFRQEFCDEYDDIRFAAFRAVRETCGDKLRALGLGPDAAAAADDAPPQQLSQRLLAACHAHVFARNAVELLLALTLPPTQAEWEAAAHACFAREQLGAALGGEAAAPAAGPAADAGAGVAAGAKRSAAKFLRDEGDYGDDGRVRLHAGVQAQGPPPAPPSAAAGGPRYASYAAQLRACGEAWLAVLRLPLPADVLRRVLLALPTRVLPFMGARQPLLLADFLTDAVSRPGGAVPLLALQSLFVLMQRHGLEYPRFYSRLYALLSADTAHAKYRARLFAQLDRFLGSTALPAYLAAAFAKRLARLALHAPVGVALFAVPAVYNIVRRHPQLLSLLHRTSGPSAASAPSAPSSASSSAVPFAAWPAPADPFDSLTDDPFATCALDSSLWELVALQTHYFGPVASLARSLAAAAVPAPVTVGSAAAGAAAALLPESAGAASPLLARPEFDVARFLEPAASGYAALAQGELRRTVRKGGAQVPADIHFEFRPAAGGTFGGAGGACAWVR